MSFLTLKKDQAPAPTPVAAPTETASTWDIGVGAFYERLEQASRAVRVYGNTMTAGKTDRDVLLSVLHPNSTLTVSVIVFNPDRTKVLLVKHPKFGWVPPGGHVDGPERPQDAAVRELREETGLTAYHFRNTPAILSLGKNRLGMIGYVAYASETQQLVAETEVQWFDLSDIPASTFPDDADRIRSAALDVPPAAGPYRVTLTNDDHIMDDVSEQFFDSLEPALRACDAQRVHDARRARHGGPRPLLISLASTGR